MAAQELLIPQFEEGKKWSYDDLRSSLANHIIDFIVNPEEFDLDEDDSGEDDSETNENDFREPVPIALVLGFMDETTKLPIFIESGDASSSLVLTILFLSRFVRLTDQQLEGASIVNLYSGEDYLHFKLMN